MRGLLLDRGIALAVSATRAQRLIPKILATPNEELTLMMRDTVASLYAFMLEIDNHIRAFDQKIEAIFKDREVCPRIARIRGIGPKTATALIAAIGDGSDFKHGRHLATWRGLVPRQHLNGARRVLMGIGTRRREATRGACRRYAYTVANGTVLYESGGHTGALLGRVLGSGQV